MDRRAEFVEWATTGRRDLAQALLDDEPALSGPDVALLLGEGAPDDPSTPMGLRGWPPLVYVTRSAFLGGERTDALLTTAAALLEAGADPDAALYGAAGVNHEPRMTALLLERGANPNDGASLFHAVESRDRTCVELLLAAGATVAGSGALANSLRFDDLEGTRLLLERLEDPAELTTLIKLAIACDRSRAHIELLIEHGAPVPPAAAALAARRGRTDLAEPLRWSAAGGRGVHGFTTR